MWAAVVLSSLVAPASRSLLVLDPLPCCQGKGAGKQTAAHLQLWYCRDGPGVDGSHAVKEIIPGLFCPAVKSSACRDHRLALWEIWGFMDFLWVLFFDLVSGLVFFSSGKVSAAQQVGQGEERSANFSLCQCDETLSKKLERRKQYISLLCSSCSTRRGRS